MGKPRLIIVIRHAQSEGNQNRKIHQTVPDHRVKLTPTGWEQAYDAGHRLREMLHPSDSIQFYVSPYRRTRETTTGIIETLTSDAPEPSPFSRSSIKVWEEPRLREQDFGNFQPGGTAMEEMWKERADYGHFFYRIPNGESAADAYDRISGFNESLWRSFGEEAFPSVCVLVTHGLMTRVFLMKWYHWSVEYFEDLRNINHVEFVVMNRSEESGRYILQNELRTWSELKRQRAAEASGEDPSTVTSPTTPARKRWGSVLGLNDKLQDAQQTSAKDATESASAQLPSLSDKNLEGAPQVLDENDCEEDDDEAFPHPHETQDSADGPVGLNSAEDFEKRLRDATRLRPIPSYLEAGRDFGGTYSGAVTPAIQDDPEVPPEWPVAETKIDQKDNSSTNYDGISAKPKTGQGPSRTPNSEEKKRWIEESGMGSGARADALGDQDEDNNIEKPDGS